MRIVAIAESHIDLNRARHDEEEQENGSAKFLPLVMRALSGVGGGAVGDATIAARESDYIRLEFVAHDFIASCSAMLSGGRKTIAMVRAAVEAVEAVGDRVWRIETS